MKKFYIKNKKAWHLKIFITGTRGIPDIPGGIEKHCQELYPIIASKEHEIWLATRSQYIKKDILEWKGVYLVKTFAPRKKSLETIIHTFLAVFKSSILRPDILHIHAIGPGLMVPLARLLGLKVVVTNHGPDYERGKWGKPEKLILKLGEYLGGRFAHEIIVISKEIQKIVKQRCKRESHLIPNGVPIPEITKNTYFLESKDILPGRYILAVSRFVPEKGLDLLIQGFKSLKSNDHQLVIAGDADHETNYSRNLKKAIDSSARIIRTGYITGELLNQLYSHARLFVLPSFHEGLPIALLEAMSYGLSVLVSDIPANIEIGLENYRYFKCGDTRDLKNKIEGLLKTEMGERDKNALRIRMEKDYNWMKAAEQTIKVYEKVLRSL